MKAYKFEVLVIDHEGLGGEEIKAILEYGRFINPHVKSIHEAEIGEWGDSHPLNQRATADEEYQRLFSNQAAENGGKA